MQRHNTTLVRCMATAWASRRIFAQAAYWYRKAAEQGLAGAQFLLGNAYDKAKGVPQDYAQAAIWYRKAAEQGFPEAQSILGILYSEGKGVPQDFAEAYFWLDIGAANQLPTGALESAKRCPNMIASHLTPADLSRVQERARKCSRITPRRSKRQGAGKIEHMPFTVKSGPVLLPIFATLLGLVGCTADIGQCHDGPRLRSARHSQIGKFPGLAKTCCIRAP